MLDFLFKKMGAFYTNFSIIMAPEFLVFFSCKSQPALSLTARFSYQESCTINTISSVTIYYITLVRNVILIF